MTANPVSGVPTRAQDIKPRAFSLELTKGCNLRCGYCYYAAREEAYDPATTMSPEVAEQSVDLLLREAEVGEPVHLHLFGGEPLTNFPLLRRVVEYGVRHAGEQGRRITFEVTTNGTRFSDKVIAFLNEHEISVGVSFDGPPEVQDESRPALKGSSHALAVPGIRRFLASRRGTRLAPKTHCSVVITRRELNLVAIVEHLEELGFECIILTPATDLTGKTHGLREDDLPELLGAYDALARRYEEHARAGKPHSVAWFNTLMGRLQSGERRTAFCQGGRDYLGVAADGKVALCYRFYEEPDYAMGDVQTGIDRSVTERILGLPVEKKPACSTCWARYFCGGGCHHENLIASGGLGDPNPVTCEILRHSMGRTLEMWARLSRDGKVGARRPVATNGESGMSNDETRDRVDGDRADDAEARTAPAFGLEDSPVRSPSCHLRDVGDERVVYQPESHEVVILNPTAHFIFDLCDGTRTVAAMLDAMCERFDAPRDVLQKDLFATLALLGSKGVLTA